jgi:hypothetical protein
MAGNRHDLDEPIRSGVSGSLRLSSDGQLISVPVLLSLHPCQSDDEPERLSEHAEPNFGSIICPKRKRPQRRLGKPSLLRSHDYD